MSQRTLKLLKMNSQVEESSDDDSLDPVDKNPRVFTADTRSGNYVVTKLQEYEMRQLKYASRDLFNHSDSQEKLV